jgi:hypothetical protein
LPEMGRWAKRMGEKTKACGEGEERAGPKGHTSRQRPEYTVSRDGTAPGDAPSQLSIRAISEVRLEDPARDAGKLERNRHRGTECAVEKPQAVASTYSAASIKARQYPQDADLRFDHESMSRQVRIRLGEPFDPHSVSARPFSDH